MSLREGGVRVPTTQKRAAGAQRLSADDWTSKALDLLMAEGRGAIKINRLCRDLGVTKGSFYWHFADLDALLAAIAKRWCDETRNALTQLEALHHLPPLERIRAMALRLVDGQSWQVERALRDWARADETVADVLRVTDRFIFDVVQAALLDVGFDADAARLRAGLLVYAGIGFAHGQDSLPNPTPEDIEGLMDFIAGDAARG